jgi:hypothetical protein
MLALIYPELNFRKEGQRLLPSRSKIRDDGFNYNEDGIGVFDEELEEDDMLHA